MSTSAPAKRPTLTSLKTELALAQAKLKAAENLRERIAAEVAGVHYDSVRGKPSCLPEGARCVWEMKGAILHLSSIAAMELTTELYR